MTIGEPRHPFPDFVGEIIAANLAGFGKYPPNDGTPELLTAIAGWLARRYGVAPDPERQIMALNGTREGLFNAAIALCPEVKGGGRPVVLMPNPFYQVYAVAALAVGAEPVYVPATAATGFLPDYAALPADGAGPGRDRLSLLAVEPAGRGGIARLSGRPDRAGREARFPDLRRRMLFRDLPRRAAARRAGGRREGRRRSRSGSSSSIRCRNGRTCRGCGPASSPAGPRAWHGSGSCAPMPAHRCRCRCSGWPNGPGATRRMWPTTARSITQKFRARGRGASPASRATAAPEGGFFLWLPVRDRRRRGGGAEARGSETGVRVLPGAYLGARGGRGEIPARATSGSRWWPR